MDNLPPQPTITLLEDKVINQIAAGEVVERPASVVKELVENSIDAGATRVEVTIEGGGATAILIDDNGRGIPAPELETALLRHATSKIDSVEDLQTISTFGFRGEALPSIASVSTFTISSRTQESQVATWFRYEGGKKVKSGERAASVGTRIEVEGLFTNLPARLKFLKTEQTETSHIQEIILKFALANPRVHFLLNSGSRRVFDFPPHSSKMERAKAVLKRRGRGAVRAQLTHFHPPLSGTVGVELILAPPEVSLRDASGLYFFVNGRSVKDRLLLRCVTGGYGSLLDRGRYPVAVVYLTLPAHEVDVNVHPQKTEVRFLHERAVAGTLRGSVTRALAEAPWRPLTHHAEGHTPTKTAPPKKYLLLDDHTAAAEEGDYEATRKRILASVAKSARTKTPPGSISNSTSQALPHGERRNYPLSPPVKLPPLAKPSPRPEMPSQEHPAPKTLRYLGSHGGLYLVFSAGERLMIMDQHAAHERVRYATILREMEESSVRSQGLLFPETIKLTAEQYEVASANLAALKSAGLEVELFGTDTVVIRSTPAVLHSPNAEALLLDVLDEIEAGGSGEELGGLRDSIAATMACHSAVRKGDTVTEAEALSLLETIMDIESGGHCPHGRPVSFEMSLAEIETRFKRR